MLIKELQKGIFFAKFGWIRRSTDFNLGFLLLGREVLGGSLENLLLGSFSNAAFVLIES